jgi:hypothetical protein
LSLPIIIKISICVSVIPILFTIPIALFLDDAQMFLTMVLVIIGYSFFIIPELTSLFLLPKTWRRLTYIVYFSPWICALALGVLPLLRGNVVVVSIVVIIYSILKLAVGVMYFLNEKPTGEC